MGAFGGVDLIYLFTYFIFIILLKIKKKYF